MEKNDEAGGADLKNWGAVNFYIDRHFQTLVFLAHFNQNLDTLKASLSRNEIDF